MRPNNATNDLIWKFEGFNISPITQQKRVELEVRKEIFAILWHAYDRIVVHSSVLVSFVFFEFKKKSYPLQIRGN